MTVAFVHGVPETAAIWEPLLAELGLPTAIAVSPPGFGASVPRDFEPTSDGYAAWLTAEIERIADESGGRVDLVGHDWGGVHAMRVATLRPDLVGRLVTDVAGTGDAKYEWHDLARIWQTEGEGEALVEALASAPLDERTASLAGAGMTPDAARSCAEAYGPQMGACILALYRSARQPRMHLWAEQYRELDDRPATLVVVASEDAYTGGPAMARRVAQAWGAAVVELDGVGHWWMLQDPARAADAMRGFLTDRPG